MGCCGKAKGSRGASFTSLNANLIGRPRRVANRYIDEVMKATIVSRIKELSNGLENTEDRGSADWHGNQHVRLRSTQVASTKPVVVYSARVMAAFIEYPSASSPREPVSLTNLRPRT